MAEKISARLQTPKDENNQRKDIHLITSTDEVMYNNGDEFITLTGKLSEILTRIEALEGR